MAAVAGLVVPTWFHPTYWDFGDGNYLYIARRLNEGLVLYRDILAPQPPLHLLSGAYSLLLGDWLFDSGLIGVRLHSLLIRFAQAALIYLIAVRFLRDRLAAAFAGILYLFLPIGFWWSMCYMSENLELVFLLFALYKLLELTPRACAVAGVASALACHTNMTGVPFLAVNLIFLLCRRPGLAIPYAATGLGTFFGGAFLASSLTDGFYWNNVLFNQVGTFPRTDILSASRPGYTFWHYAVDKVTSQGANVIRLEGAFLIAAAIALALRATEARSTDADPESRLHWHRTEFMAWSAIGMWLSICFTAKGGTMDYIFTLGEPAVALFAADGFTRLVRLAWPAGTFATLSFANTQVFLRLFFPVFAAVVAFTPGVVNIRQTLSETQAELPANEVRTIEAFIRTYTKPGDTILAPPFYAWISDTRVAGELAENYIWQITWMNEAFDFAQGNRTTVGPGTLKMAEVAAQLANREIPLVLLDLNQTGTVPEIRAAIEAHYIPAEPRPLRTRNTSLGLYVPRGTELRHVPLFAPAGS